MNRIAELRKKQGISQTELAKLLGIAQNTLSQYENNRRTPPNCVIMNIADLFAVSTNEVLNDPESSKTHEMFFSRSFYNVSKVEQTESTNKVNLLISLGWELLHIGNISTRYDDGSCDSHIEYTLGWCGNPEEVTVATNTETKNGLRGKSASS